MAIVNRTAPLRTLPTAAVSSTEIDEGKKQAGEFLPNRKLLTIGEAVSLYGISSQTLRMWCRRKLVVSVRQDRGWNRILKDSLESYLGVARAEEIKKENDKCVGIYCRRSSQGTRDKVALDAQQEELLAYCVSTYGVRRESVRIYREQTSGVTMAFKTRKEFARLLNDVIAGKLSVVVVKDKSRVARIDCHDLAALIFAQFGTNLVHVHEWAEGDNDELGDEIGLLLDYLQHFTSKRSAAKMVYKKIVKIEGETRETILRLHGQGMSISAIQKYCEKQGIKGCKNDGSEQRLSRNAIHRFLQKHAKLPIEQGTNSIDMFSRKCILKKKGAEVASKEMYNKYVEYCHKNGTLVTSHYAFSARLVKLGFEIVASKGQKYFSGVALK